MAAPSTTLPDATDVPAVLARARAAFDASTDFTMGVEEELAICDAHTLDLSPQFASVSAYAQAAGFEKNACSELLASEIEFRTDAHDEWAGAAQQVAALRAGAIAAAREAGVVLGASATHPFADYREQSTVDSPYYRRITERMQWFARRNVTFGLHVHVGVRGAERAIAVHDELRAWVPALLALSASSPFLDGLDTGLASSRSAIFSRLFPRANVPPVWGTFDAFTQFVHDLWEADSIFSANQVWHTVRLHPLYGTVELRCFDGQPDERDTQALAALACGLVADIARQYDAGELPHPVRHHVVDDNTWRAARWGLDAEFVRAPGTPRVAMRDIVAELIARARSANEAFTLGLEPGLDRAQRMLEAGGSAATQRAWAQARGGDLRAAYEQVVELTMQAQKPLQDA